MSPADKAIAEILKRYGEDFSANTWVVPGGKARAIQHKCIERMCIEAGITFDPPTMVRAEADWCVMVVTGHITIGDVKRTEWSVGEAAPKNNKNAYPYSMAEKRGKDRVALKLIGLHGLLYSEEEADDFRQSSSRQIERPESRTNGHTAPASRPVANRDDADASASQRLARELSAKLWKVSGEAAVQGVTSDPDFRQRFKALEAEDQTRLGELIRERRAAQ